MGRYRFEPQRVHKVVTDLMDRSQLQAVPTWYGAVGDFPPAERLTRPALQGSKKGSKKGKGRASQMFKPVVIKYPEDRLRETFFGDHPWELARPRTVVEVDGKDYLTQDWSAIDAAARTRSELTGQQQHRPLTGESVVQRQRWLMKHEKYTRVEAYDRARKEFYKLREAQEIREKVAREEALHYGAQFGKTPAEVGVELEDKEWDRWKSWAKQEVDLARQMQDSMYSGMEIEDGAVDNQDTLDADDGQISNDELLAELVSQPDEQNASKT